MHYKRLRKGQPLNASRSDLVRAARGSIPECSVGTCAGVPVGHGYCNAHYLRFKKHGTPGDERTGPAFAQRSVSRAVRDSNHKEVLALLESKCRVGADGCWVWTGANANGYGRVGTGTNGKSDFTHRVAMAAHMGVDLAAIEPNPVHHKCANNACCNPEHLQLVTSQDNLAEMMQRQTYLKRIKALEDALRELDNNHPLL